MKTVYQKLPQPLYWNPLAAALALVLCAIPALAAVNYVTLDGSPTPLADNPGTPFDTVGAAVQALPTGGGAVSIAPGNYREKLTISTPALLTAPSGAVEIGDLTGTVTFNVFSWNTHLFGDHIGSPSWKDYERAADIGRDLAGRHADLDLVSLCEVWDEDLLTDYIQPLSGFSSWHHGGRVDQQTEGPDLTCPFPVPPHKWVTVLNSGLAMMTKHSMSDSIQVSFDECEGSCPYDGDNDCLASKGFIISTVVKGGFTLRVFNTHAQAGTDDQYVEARLDQIKQLAANIASYRLVHPSHLVLVMGDINVEGEENEYSALQIWFGQLGNGHDAARNAPNLYLFENRPASYSLRATNDLAQYFDSGPFNKRLDYVWYFPSLDGTVKLHPERVAVVTPEGSLKSEDELTTKELSDHYPLQANLRLYRVP